MILLVAAMLCACGGYHNETNELSDTTKEVGYEVVAIVPDTVVGRFIEPNGVDTLLFRWYSEKENRYFDSMPMYESWWNFEDRALERNAVIRVELIDGGLLRTISDAERISDYLCIGDCIRPLSGVDALGIAEADTYNPPCIGKLHIISL